MSITTHVKCSVVWLNQEYEEIVVQTKIPLSIKAKHSCLWTMGGNWRTWRIIQIHEPFHPNVCFYSENSLIELPVLFWVNDNTDTPGLSKPVHDFRDLIAHCAWSPPRCVRCSNRCMKHVWGTAAVWYNTVRHCGSTQACILRCRTCQKHLVHHLVLS